MPGMTKLQRNYLEDIEKNLNVEYTGQNTRKGADLFIKDHKEENTKYKLECGKQFPPTGKQKRLIKDIEKNLDIKFTGRTVRTASKFISKNMSEFKSSQSRDQKMIHYCYNVSKKIERNIEKKRRLVNE